MQTEMLHMRILWELVRFDVPLALAGLKAVRSRVRVPVRAQSSPDLTALIRDTFAAVAPFYWKPIRCLQRSIVTARVMRLHGIAAEVVVGYRPSPFFSHAWV